MMGRRLTAPDPTPPSPPHRTVLQPASPAPRRRGVARRRPPLPHRRRTSPSTNAPVSPPWVESLRPPPSPREKPTARHPLPIAPCFSPRPLPLGVATRGAARQCPILPVRQPNPKSPISISPIEQSRPASLRPLRVSVSPRLCVTPPCHSALFPPFPPVKPPASPLASVPSFSSFPSVKINRASAAPVRSR